MPDLATVAPSTWFALGYAAVLLAVAYGIDRLARRAATNVEQHRSGGFRYHADHDAWVCPEDQWLWPHSFDPENRVMRYRGSPTVCNSCPVRESCTTSASGREVQRQVDPWPASESARFHRGIACAVTVMAAAWPLAAVFAAPGLVDGVLLAIAVVLLVLGSLPLWAHLRRTPADPTGVLTRSTDDNVADRQEIARRYHARRTSYRSDRLPIVSVTHGPTNGGTTDGGPMTGGPVTGSSVNDESQRRNR